jgi:hypothetical protein
VEHSHFFEQDHNYTTTLALADFGAQFYQQRINIAPLDVSACRAGEDQLKSSLVLALHARIVPLSGTEMGERTNKRSSVEVGNATRLYRGAFPRLKGQPSRYAICPIARRSSMVHNGNDEDLCGARPKYHAKGKAFDESAAGVFG